MKNIQKRTTLKPKYNDLKELIFLDKINVIHSFKIKTQVTICKGNDNNIHYME